MTGLARGLPVIGFAKGGMKNFVDPALDISEANGQHLEEKLYHLIHRLKKMEQFTHTLPITDILKEHEIENRKSNIAYLLGDKKKILIASDFINRIG